MVRHPAYGKRRKRMDRGGLRLADYQTFRRLEKIAGQKLEYNVRNHNLAKLSLPALKALAKSNRARWAGGSAGGEKRDDLEERRIHFNRLKHDPCTKRTKCPRSKRTGFTPARRYPASRRSSPRPEAGAGKA